MQYLSSLITKNERTCTQDHKLKMIGYLQRWSKLMVPLGFMANFGSIVALSSLVIGFGNHEYLEVMLWTIYGAAIYLGLIGFLKSWLPYRNFVPGQISFNEPRLRFYEGWLFSTATILILLIFGFVVENFARSHPFNMQR